MIFNVKQIACYSMSLAPVTWVLVSKIFPARIRGAAMSVAVSALWLACFLLTFTFPMLNAQLDAAETFFLYAAICVAGFVFIKLKLPETKNKSSANSWTDSLMKQKIIFLLAVVFLIAARPLRAVETIPLDGEWRFALDRTTPGRTKNGSRKICRTKSSCPAFFRRKATVTTSARTRRGCLRSAMRGGKSSRRVCANIFPSPATCEVPFLSQPPKHYLGAAWYQRDIEIPANWRGRHFTLFLERAHWQSTVWVDDQEFPANDSLVAPHITDLGVLTPGKHRLTIRVDNRLQLPAAGHLVDSHSISDALGAAWNGIVGKIELRARRPVWIEDVQVFPNVSNKTALVKIKIGNAIWFGWQR